MPCTQELQVGKPFSLLLNNVPEASLTHHKELYCFVILQQPGCLHEGHGIFPGLKPGNKSNHKIPAGKSKLLPYSPDINLLAELVPVKEILHIKHVLPSKLPGKLCHVMMGSHHNIGIHKHIPVEPFWQAKQVAAMHSNHQRLLPGFLTYNANKPAQCPVGMDYVAVFCLLKALNQEAEHENRGLHLGKETVPEAFHHPASVSQPLPRLWPEILETLYLYPDQGIL